jgi:hypothetical protein
MYACDVVDASVCLCRSQPRRPHRKAYVSPSQAGQSPIAIPAHQRRPASGGFRAEHGTAQAGQAPSTVLRISRHRLGCAYQFAINLEAHLNPVDTLAPGWSLRLGMIIMLVQEAQLGNCVRCHLCPGFQAPFRQASVIWGIDQPSRGSVVGIVSVPAHVGPSQESEL